MTLSESVRLYVGGLAEDTRPEELERLFGKFGEIGEVSVKRFFGFVVSKFIWKMNTMGCCMYLDKKK